MPHIHIYAAFMFILCYVTVLCCLCVFVNVKSEEKKVAFLRPQHEKCTFGQVQPVYRTLIIHHNLFKTLLLGSTAETLFVKQLHYIQTKMYRLYRKMTIYGHFSI